MLVTAARAYRITPIEVLDGSYAHAVEARQVLAAHLRERFFFSWPELARLFGYHHATMRGLVLGFSEENRKHAAKIIWPDYSDGEDQAGHGA